MFHSNIFFMKIIGSTSQSGRIAIWGIVGYLTYSYSYQLGYIPCSFRGDFYYQIESFALLKLCYNFFEIHLIKFVCIVFGTIVLCIISHFETIRLCSFLLCYNIYPLHSIYLYFYVGKWNNYSVGSIEHSMLNLMPVFVAISILSALLGCYIGGKIRANYMPR
jgi:hypothetical protein